MYAGVCRESGVRDVNGVSSVRKWVDVRWN
jgi:hypothetical protein